MNHRARRAAPLVLLLSGCPGWSSAILVDERPLTDPGNGYQGPLVAAEVEGNGVAALWQFGSSGQVLRAARGLSAVTVASDGSSSTSRHAVAAAGDGSAMAVFGRASGLAWSRSASGVAWSPAVALPEAGLVPAVAGDRSGNMVAAWWLAGNVRAARFTAATSSWGPVETIGIAQVEPALIDLSMNTRGAGIAAWCSRRPDGTRAVAVNRFAAGSWAGEELLATVPQCLRRRGEFDTPLPRTVDTDMAETGVPTVVFTDGSVRVRRFRVPFSGPPAWQPAETLWTPPAGHRITHLRVAVNQDGDALAAWYTEDAGLVARDVLGAHYSDEFRIWGGVSTVAAGAAPQTASLGVGIDRQRRGMVVYQAGYNAIAASRFDGARFAAPVTLADHGAYEFDFAMNRAGSGYLVWAYANRQMNLNVFTP